MEPACYRLTITARSAEYKNSKAEHIFTVLPNPTPAPSVSVDQTSVYMGERYTFTIDTTGAEELRYKRTNYSSSDQRINVLEDTTRWTTYRSSATEAQYQFAVLKDGHWSSWSEPIAITVKALDPLAEPTFALPETLTAGENLTVQINAVPNATEYQVSLLNGRGVEIASRYYSGSDDNTVTFEGYLISAGVVKVQVRAYGNNLSSQASASLRVLAGSRPEAPKPETDISLTQSSSRVNYTVNAEGAEQAAVRYYQVGYPNQINYENIVVSNGSLKGSAYLYGSGSVYTFSFTVKRDGVWSSWSGGIEVTLE